ncbi:uncharacterized protein EV420DRAFT_1760093 [Desarmillaria tabescens]|uniref:Uncharacterized protein n=1 Tax=Armillaria tabescens TaxID=1929756 RepID=A0AA39NGV9_ARMTA|nr:uncharacterized protein EV420DRAFT_1760093 [Desarmillaria tabescens]KAK0465411.1 hypothetical protein EV420DRAFT_1760093 [Desarmillaria tabescens]
MVPVPVVNDTSAFLLQLPARKSHRNIRSNTSVLPRPYPPTAPFYSSFLLSSYLPTRSSSVITSPLRNTPTGLSCTPVCMNANDSQSHGPVSSTANKLDESKDKATLLKKARKLSRVFGEAPSLDQSIAAVGPSKLFRHKRSTSSVSSPLGSPKSNKRYTSQPDLRQAEVPPLPQINETAPGWTPQAIPSDSPSSVSLHTDTCHSNLNDSLSSLVSAAVAHTTAERSKNITTDQQPSLPPIPRLGRTKKPGRRKAARMRSFDFTSDSDRQVDGSNAKLKRSRSLFTHKQGRTDASEESLDFRQRYNRNFGEEGEISPRQRLLNVKRARKMAQVFGQDPPSELILIDDARPSSRRHSFSSNVSSHSIVPPTPALVYSPSSSPEDERMLPYSVNRSNNDAPADSSDADDCTFTSAFRERRRRAAKLSRFFGVAYQDMSSSIPTTAPPIEEQVERPTPDVQVDVQVTGRRFWGFDGGYTTREADIADVIDKLRCLKAA